MIAYGTGTSLEGHVAALRGGITLNLMQMNAVLEVNAEDLDCLVQAGVTRKQLNAELRDTGLFFPIDPGADASIGGMAATRASGTNAVRYGTMRENVLGLTVVLADGRVIRTGGRARKSSSGYDLTRLFVGSEGTLGVITEIRLRLHGIPEAISSAVCAFPTIEQAVDTVIATIQSGVPVARIELLDEVQMEACIRFSKLEQYRVAPTLFFEFHGSRPGSPSRPRPSRRSPPSMAAPISSGRPGPRIAIGSGRRATTPSTPPWRCGRAARASSATSACRSRALPSASRRPSARSPRRRLLAPMVGHVGDGNFHLVFIVDPEDQDEIARAKQVGRRLVEQALALGGTCSGEHGVGQGKIDYLAAEHGEAVQVMRAIKQALDPDNIMNPGKIVPL